jgi:hypothetical protein
MIKGLVEIISRQSAHRNVIRQVTLIDPLRRFNEDQYFSLSKLHNRIATALAKQTNQMVEALLSDQAIPDWKRAGDCATPQQISDLSIFCSHCLVQFTIKDLQVQSVELALAWLNDGGLRADISDLTRVMYGDFVAEDRAGGLTFEESLASRDLSDPQDMRYLTRLLDQLMGLVEMRESSQRDVKIRKLRKLLNDHSHSFAYTLHSVLK